MIKFLFLIVISLYTCFVSADEVDDLSVIKKEDIVIGDLNAKSTIVEYSSLSCPLCGYFHTNVLPEIKKKYLDTKKVKFIFRHFPIKPIDLKAVSVSLCVPDDKRSVFLDVLFKTQRNWSIESSHPVETLESISRLSGINGEIIKQCLEDKALEEKIISLREYAQNNMKINSTPTFFINGKKINGLVDIKIIEKELA